MSKPFPTRLEIVSIQPESFLPFCPSAFLLANNTPVNVFRREAIMSDYSTENLHLLGALSANDGVALSHYRVAQLMCVESMLSVSQPDGIQILVNGWEEYLRQFGEYFHPAQIESAIVLVLNFTDVPHTSEILSTKLYWKQRARHHDGIEVLDVTQDTWYTRVTGKIRFYSEEATLENSV
jgi:hypothetical protein